MLLDYGGSWLMSVWEVLVTLSLERWVLVTPAALFLFLGLCYIVTDQLLYISVLIVYGGKSCDNVSVRIMI